MIHFIFIPPFMFEVLLDARYLFAIVMREFVSLLIIGKKTRLHSAELQSDLMRLSGAFCIFLVQLFHAPGANHG